MGLLPFLVKPGLRDKPGISEWAVANMEKQRLHK
jgi:hypothetical protein